MMTDEPEEKTDDEIFTEFLDKVGPGWLEKWLTTNADKLPKMEAPKPEVKTAEGLETFLAETVKELKAEGASLREALTDALDMLTPEQRQTLKKSRAKPNEGDPPSPTPKKPNVPPSEPKPKPKGLTGLLKRL